MSRSTTFDQELADEICRRLAAGESLREICQTDTMPSRAAVIGWKNTIPEFNDQYARAREDQAELYADDIVDISDNGSNDWMTRRGRDGEIEVTPNHEHLARSRLRVDSRKWLLSKLKPGTYGDKLQHANAAGDGNLTVNVVKFGVDNPSE